jgi:integrase
MVPPVRDALQSHQQVQVLERLMLGEAWQGEVWGGLVFTNEKGGPLSGGHTLVCLRRALRRVELPPIRQHDLRHGAASLLAAMGVPPRDVMDILGHSNVATTLGLYTHSTTELRREAMERLGRSLWPSAD